MRNAFLGLAGGLGLGAGGCYFYLYLNKKIVVPSVADTHPALKHGLPETDILRVYERFATSYDYRTRNPKWVIEKFGPEDIKGEGDGDRSKSGFHEDDGVEARFRTKLSDYRGSGFDRGHMAPAADHKTSQKAMDETFTLSNMSPQVGKGFNRDYWSRFERYVRGVTRKAESVYVVTGPLWLPTVDPSTGNWVTKHMHIGEPPGMTAVPTHYYKVVLAEAPHDTQHLQEAASKALSAASSIHAAATTPAGTAGKESAMTDAASQALSVASAVANAPSQKVAVGAFVMPNAPIDPNMPLEAFVVPLEALEAVAGIKFFPKYLTGDRRKALDVAAAGWRAHGVMHVKPSERLMITQGQAVIPLSEAHAAPVHEKAKRGSKVAAPEAKGHAWDMPKTVGGQGAVHLCEFSTCSLPAAFAAAAVSHDGSEDEE